jgi:hypothetical protein
VASFKCHHVNVRTTTGEAGKHNTMVELRIKLIESGVSLARSGSANQSTDKLVDVDQIVCATDMAILLTERLY